MKVFYARVSTELQNLGRQEEDFKKSGADKLITEKVSGKSLDRPELKKVLFFLSEGDTLIVSSLDRLGRSTRDVLNILQELEDKGITFISMKENYDTSDPRGKFMITVMAAVATMERELMLERQREGIAIAKMAGKFKGKPALKKPKEWNEVYSQWKTRELTGTEAIKSLEVSRATFYKWIKEHEEEIRKSEVQKHGELPEKNLFSSEEDK